MAIWEERGGLGQFVAAITAAPEATAEQIENAKKSTEQIFERGNPVESGGILFGWLRYVSKDPMALPYPQAEASIWPVIALSELHVRKGAISDAEHSRYEAYLAYAQRAAELYFMPDGGWNHFPRQVESQKHAMYTTLSGFEAMLLTRESKLKWAGIDSSGLESKIGATFHFLMKSYDRSGDWAKAPGWHASNDFNREVSPKRGLALYGYALLLRATRNRNLQITADLLADMETAAAKLAHGDVSPLDTDTDRLSARFIAPDGKEIQRDYEWKLERLPWAIAFAVEWTEHLRRSNSSLSNIVSARRSLNSLIHDAGLVSRHPRRNDFYRAELLYRLDAIR